MGVFPPICLRFAESSAVLKVNSAPECLGKNYVDPTTAEKRTLANFFAKHNELFFEMYGRRLPHWDVTF
jgi:hypothetical protein